VQQFGGDPSFFDFAHVDDICRRMTLIVPCTDNASTKSKDKSVQDRYETGAKAECGQDSLQLTFAGSVAAVHVKSIGRSCKKVSGRAAFHAIRGQHFGKDAARVQVGDALQELRNMCYKGESRNWGFTKHSNKAIEFRHYHDLYTKQCGVPEMSEHDFIGHFLHSFKEDCNNPTLLNYVAIIRGARDQ
jgi:hypothetical protein